MAITIKTLQLTFDVGGAGEPLHVECQLDTCELVDAATSEEIVTFCGPESSSTPKYQLNVGGFQDYGAVNAVCDLLHEAYVARRDNPLDPAAGKVAFVQTVGTKTRSGDCRPTVDVPFGGAAGPALKFTTTLEVVGNPTDGTVAAP